MNIDTDIQCTKEGKRENWILFIIAKYNQFLRQSFNISQIKKVTSQNDLLLKMTYIRTLSLYIDIKPGVIDFIEVLSTNSIDLTKYNHSLSSHVQWYFFLKPNQP